MDNFTEELNDKIDQSIYNNYKDNWDVHRFGPATPRKLRGKIKEMVRSIMPHGNIPYYDKKRRYGSYNKIKDNYIVDLNNVFDDLHDDYSKQWLVDLMAYKILGYKKVKLPTNTSIYKEYYPQVDKLITGNEKIDPKFLHFILQQYNLQSIGYPIKLFLRSTGIIHHFILQQYNYKDFIKAEEGDVVFDAGGCWGDTALYFAHKVGEEGKVYTVEFIPNNLEILSKNLQLNPVLRKQIEVLEHPLWSKDKLETYYLDNGPASKVSFEKFTGNTGKTSTITIDSFCERNNLQRVDFIKMDIEGAEPNALNGAINTIKNLNQSLPFLPIIAWMTLFPFHNGLII